MPWPFFRNKRKEFELPIHVDEPEPRRPMRFEHLVADMGNFSDFEDHDVAIKFWLPEPVAQALDELRGRRGESMSELLRQFLVVHCYGMYAFQVMNDVRPSLFRDPDIRFSRSAPETPKGKKRVTTYFVPELGKNVAPIKVWVPKRLRDDLQLLADHVQLKLSQYLREIAIARLLGHGTLPMRPEMLEASPVEAAEDWCEDREVPWREVDKEEYWEARERRMVETLVDKQL